MLIKDAIVMRLKNICEEKNICFNDLAVRSGVTPSTVYSLIKEERRDFIGNYTEKALRRS